MARTVKLHNKSNTCVQWTRSSDANSHISLGLQFAEAGRTGRWFGPAGFGNLRAPGGGILQIWETSQMANRDLTPWTRGSALSPFGGRDPFSSFRREMDRLFDDFFAPAEGR